MIYIYTKLNGFNIDTILSRGIYYTPLKFIYPIDDKIINIESTIYIGFCGYALELKYDTSILLQKMFPGIKMNDEYKFAIRHKEDTIVHKVNYYAAEKSEKLFNATIAALFLCTKKK